jgi:hypothetical protein
MTRRVAAPTLDAGAHRRGGSKDKAQAGLAANELTPDWAVVRLYRFTCNTPGYWTVGPAFVSTGLEIQFLPGGPLSLSFVPAFGKESL